jgi:hypothetical protein
LGKLTRYRALPDQAYDPRVTDMEHPFNVPSSTGPMTTTTDPKTGNPVQAGGWVNRNVTNTIPIRLPGVVAGVSSGTLRVLPNNPRRTGLLIQNIDAVNALNFSFANDLQGNGALIGAGGAILLDFTTAPDALYLFSAVPLSAIVIEFTRGGGG